MAKSRTRNRNRLVKAQAYAILLLLVLFGGVIGRVTAPKQTETITVTETVEVPAYEEDTLPADTEVTYFDVPLSHNLQKYIYEICADEGVPVTLVMAMIEHESDFNPETVSDTSDYGLMQINEINHDQLAESFRTADMLNPYQNVFCGVKIIASYLTEFEDYNKALMAYNMGEYGAEKAWENGVESTDYSKSVIALMEHYEEVLKEYGY
jgi:soluble lytic murein transglycosylase-like protein